jgi:hypothetical protein
MNWQSEDPFSGTFIKYDENAQSALAARLHGHADDAGTHGQTFTEHTQSPVGSGELGGRVSSAFTKMAVGFGQRFVTTYQSFLHETATLAEHSMSTIHDIDVRAAKTHDGIGPHEKPPVLGNSQVNHLEAAVNHDVDVSKITPQPLEWSKGGSTFRSDDRGPEDVYDNGFSPWNSEPVDIGEYVQNNTHSALVSTTMNPSLFERWDKEWLHVVNTGPGIGIDVDATLKNAGQSNLIKLGEEEIAHPGGIKTQYIQGAWKTYETGQVGHWLGLPPSIKGRWIDNPHFIRGYPK